jgi:hypothetical protein
MSSSPSLLGILEAFRIQFSIEYGKFSQALSSVKLGRRETIKFSKTKNILAL